MTASDNSTKHNKIAAKISHIDPANIFIIPNKNGAAVASHFTAYDQHDICNKTKNIKRP